MRVYTVAPWLLLAACSTSHGQRSGADDARAPSAESADAAPTVEAASGSTPVTGDADAPEVDARDATAAHDAEATASAGARSCDARTVTCRRAQPACGELEAPAVQDGCWGPCVPIAECACTVADDCPDRNRFTCHLYAAHCGPYVH